MKIKRDLYYECIFPIEAENISIVKVSQTTRVASSAGERILVVTTYTVSYSPLIYSFEWFYYSIQLVHFPNSILFIVVYKWKSYTKCIIINNEEGQKWTENN